MAPSRHFPGWLWPNLLSLDAPLVAVAWYAFFARAHHGKLSAPDAALLFLTVWIIYVLDRLLDGRNSANIAALQQRHKFCKRHRAEFAAALVIAALACAFIVARYLAPSEIVSGLNLAAIVALYMIGVHASRGRIALLVPKEIAVGAVFAAGVALPFWSHAAKLTEPAVLPWIFFAVLCALNCLAIECWEAPATFNERASGMQISPFVRWALPRLNAIAAALALTAFLAAILLHSGASPFGVFWAVAFAALSLLAANLLKNKIPPALLRVLADAALLLPPAVALLLLAFRL